MYEEYNNKSYSITAEQAKEVEVKQEKEFLVYYLRKTLGTVGDVKISEAIAQLEKELEPEIEPSILNLELESKTVKCEELEGYDYWREKDGTEVVKKVNTDSVDGRMQKFYDEHCEKCGSQRCLGVYDEDWREGCKLYKEEFCN